MNHIIKICYYLLSVVVIMMAVVSCKKSELDELNLSRRFQPAAFDITSGETSATIKWNESLFTTSGEVEYELELSTDPDFGTVDFAKSTTATEMKVFDTDIDIKVDYYARVRALGVDKVKDSNWLVSEAFQITGEIFILPVREFDILVNEALIRWQVQPNLAKIVVTQVGGASVDVVITAADGEKVIDGLSASTMYTVELFTSENVSKGALTFTTKPSYEGSNIIDLRGIDIAARPTILADTLGQIASGSVVLLKRGVTYIIPSAENLDRSVTITSGADFIPELAVIFMSSNFNLVASSSIDSLVFKDLAIFSDNYDSKYVFNINQIGDIGKVRFENVRGHRFRGFFRMQTGSTGTHVTDLVINNCVIDSLRDFSLVNTNNSNNVANIKVTNTTLYSARKVIDHRSPGSSSIVFENCTFNNLPTGGATGGGSFYFIDLNTANVDNGIQITNCIFGKSRDENMGGVDANGIRAGSATSVTVTNSYSTSDFVSTNQSYKIQGLIEYPANSTSVFVDPDIGNFRFKDNSFPGRTNAGDPRWRP